MGNKVKKMIKFGFVSEKPNNKRVIIINESFYIFGKMRFIVGLFPEKSKHHDSNLDRYVLADFEASVFNSELEFSNYMNDRLLYIQSYIQERNPNYEILVDRNEYNRDISRIHRSVEYYYKYK